MRTYQALSVLGFLYLGLCGTTALAQKSEKKDISAAMPTQVYAKDIEKLNYQFALEINKKEYSGYSQLGINFKDFDYLKTEHGHFKIGTLSFDKKVILVEKTDSKTNLIDLERWAKENVSYKGNLIFVIDAVVLNVKPDLVIIDKGFIVDYSVTPLDQIGLESSTAVVQLRMKTKENFKKMAVDKKKKSE